MKQFPLISLTLALALSAGAQTNNNPAITTAIAAAPDTNAVVAGPTVAGFTASAATLTAPLMLTNDCIVLTNDSMADVTSGGKAVFAFTLTNAGDYVLEAVALGPDDNSNSYFVNMDAMPTDDMIWDLNVGDDFEKQLVNWRGSGEAGSGEFTPKVFKLEAGKHQIIVTGREPGTELKSIAVCPAVKPKSP